MQSHFKRFHNSIKSSLQHTAVKCREIKYHSCINLNLHAGNFTKTLKLMHHHNISWFSTHIPQKYKIYILKFPNWHKLFISAIFSSKKFPFPFCSVSAKRFVSLYVLKYRIHYHELHIALMKMFSLFASSFFSTSR